MAKIRKVSSISKEFDGKEVQGKLIERSGLFGSNVSKEVFKMPGGGRHVEKTRTNKKGNVISRLSKDTKVNPFKKGGSTKATKFAALAFPYDKATAADRIAGAKKNAKKK